MIAPVAGVTYLTSAHNCMNKAEITRIHNQWRARKFLEEMRLQTHVQMIYFNLENSRNKLLLTRRS